MKESYKELAFIRNAIINIRYNHIKIIMVKKDV